MKKFYVWFFIFYLLFAGVVSWYLFSLKPGFVPHQYVGTVADPTTFMSKTQIEEAHHLDLINYFTFFLETPLDFLLMIVLMIVSTKWRDKAKKIFKKSFWQLGLYYLIFTLVTTVLYLPLEAFFFYLNHAYGLSDQSVWSYLKDDGISMVLDIVLSVPFMWGMLWLIRKFPKRWWVITWLVSIPLTVTMVFLAPVFIMPLFNDYKPLKDGKLKTDIHQMAKEAGIEDAKILEMNMSKQTNTINAFVTGFGSNKQIVIGDTALKNMTNKEILFVMGHEMGHYKLKHIYQSLVLSVFTSFVLALGTYYLYNWLLKKWGHLWSIESQYDIAALPLLLLSFGLLSFILSPIDNIHSRHLEKEADRYGIEMTQNKDAAVSAFQTLTKNVKSTGYTPAVLHFPVDSHPRITERIDFVHRYQMKDKK